MTLTGEYQPSPEQWVRDQVEEYEASGGTRGHLLFDRPDRPVVILTSVGAKSGKLRKTPVMRVEHEGRYAAVASQGGAPTHPTWYHNFLAHPRVDLQDGPEPKPYVARLLEGEERDAWWQRAVDVYPPYANYAEKTDRQIPVFVLEPIAEEA